MKLSLYLHKEINIYITIEISIIYISKDMITNKRN